MNRVFTEGILHTKDARCWGTTMNNCVDAAKELFEEDRKVAGLGRMEVTDEIKMHISLSDRSQCSTDWSVNGRWEVEVVYRQIKKNQKLYRVNKIFFKDGFSKIEGTGAWEQFTKKEETDSIEGVEVTKRAKKVRGDGVQAFPFTEQNNHAYSSRGSPRQPEVVGRHKSCTQGRVTWGNEDSPWFKSHPKSRRTWFW